MTVTHSECLELVARQFGVSNWNVLSAKIDAERRQDTAAATPGGALAMQPAIPILRIASEETARESYVDFLGFAVDWEHRFDDDLPLYAQVSRSQLKLHLSEHYGDAVPGSTVYLWMTGIELFQRELIAKEYRHARPGITEAPWAREMEIADPFGNRLRFAESIRAAR